MSGVKDTAAGPTVEETSADWLPFPEEVRDWGPGRKLTYAMLWELEEATGSEIADAADIATGTVYPALHWLEDLGWAERRPALEGNREFWTLTEQAGGDSR